MGVTVELLNKYELEDGVIKFVTFHFILISKLLRRKLIKDTIVCSIVRWTCDVNDERY